MSARRAASHAGVAADVWRRLFDFFMRTRPQRDRLLSRLGLTPNDARALGSIDVGEGRSMQSLAEEWMCDPSNVTIVVDRLERLGLAKRRAPKYDRRIKLVALTPLGRRAKQTLLRGIYRPPEDLLALDRAALEGLLAAVTKLGSVVRDRGRRSRARGRP